MKRAALALACLLALFPTMAAGQDEPADNGVALPQVESAAGPEFDDVFDFSRARRPRPGEWLEYHIAFPVDPLENSLSPSPAPVPGVEAERSAGALPDSGDDYAAALDPSFIQPMFEPPQAWRTIPVRVEIREVADDGCNAEIVFAGTRRTVRLAAANRDRRAEFFYDRGGDTGRQVVVGGTEYTVEETRRSGSGFGFVRWFSPDVPFGIVRFASEHIDMHLVGMGMGTGADFPLRVDDRIDPPLGLLFPSGDE